MKIMRNQKIWVEHVDVYCSASLILHTCSLQRLYACMWVRLMVRLHKKLIPPLLFFFYISFCLSALFPCSPSFSNVYLLSLSSLYPFQIVCLRFLSFYGTFVSQCVNLSLQISFHVVSLIFTDITLSYLHLMSRKNTCMLNAPKHSRGSTCFHSIHAHICICAGWTISV